MAEQSRRFVSLDKPIDKFIEDQKNKNTLSKTRRDISLLTEFMGHRTEIQCLFTKFTLRKDLAR